jgi:hypothetical protein
VPADSNGTREDRTRAKMLSSIASSIATWNDAGVKAAACPRGDTRGRTDARLPVNMARRPAKFVPLLLVIDNTSINP